MTIKEAPLIKAASKTGPMKLPSTSFWSGVFAVYSSAFFGAIFAIFWASIGIGFSVQSYEVALTGIFLAFAFTGTINIGILFAACFGFEEESKHRFQYVKGSFCAYVSFFVILLFVHGPITKWLELV